MRAQKGPPEEHLVLASPLYNYGQTLKHFPKSFRSSLHLGCFFFHGREQQGILGGIVRRNHYHRKRVLSRRDQRGRPWNTPVTHDRYHPPVEAFFAPEVLSGFKAFFLTAGYLCPKILYNGLKIMDQYFWYDAGFHHNSVICRAQ